MQTRGGYTPAEISEWYWEDVIRIRSYWSRIPSQWDLVHIIAIALGFKPAGSADQASSQPMEIPAEFED